MYRSFMNEHLIGNTYMRAITPHTNEYDFFKRERIWEVEIREKVATKFIPLFTARYIHVHTYTYTNHMCLMEEVSDEPVDLLLHMYIRSLQLSD